MIVEEVELQRLGVQHTGQVVLRLQRSNYGLKQAGRLWSNLLQVEMLRAGFVRCMTDTCVFKIDSEVQTVVGVYVDDLLVTGSTQKCVDQVFMRLATLQIKDLRVANTFLEMIA